MKPIFYALILLLTLTSATAQISEHKALNITRLTGNFYVYTTYGSADGQPYPANSMYLVTDNGVVLFDTPWDTTQFQPLLDSIKARHFCAPVFCIATHFHEDRSGGLDFYKSKGISTWSSALTYDLCSRNNKPKAAHTFSADTTFTVGNKSFRVIYPGPGHTKDNIVVWFPDDKVLYGGCFIKSTDTKSLGNIADADLKAWPASIKKVNRECPDPAYVITGHLSWGGKEQLDHTLALLKHRHKRRWWPHIRFRRVKAA